MSVNSRFYKWLYMYAEKKIRESHLSKHYNDIKCPNCKQWFSVSGQFNKHSRDNGGCDEFVTGCVCGNCQHVSYWNMAIAPFPILSDISGNPLHS